MGFVKSRRAIIWGSAVAVFAMGWGWAVSYFGMMGLYTGWLPALILAPAAAALAEFLWSVIALTALLGWHCRAGGRGGAFGA